MVVYPTLPVYPPSQHHNKLSILSDVLIVSVSHNSCCYYYLYCVFDHTGGHLYTTDYISMVTASNSAYSNPLDILACISGWRIP